MKGKTLFIVLVALGVLSLFLPWSSIDGNYNLMTGFNLLIERPFSSIGNIESLISPFFLLFIVLEGYVIGLILASIFFYLKKRKIFIWSMVSMSLGLTTNYILIGFQSFGGDVQNSVSYGTGYWLAVFVTLILLAWGLRKIPLQG